MHKNNTLEVPAYSGYVSIPNKIWSKHSSNTWRGPGNMLVYVYYTCMFNAITFPCVNLSDIPKNSVVRR